MMPYDDPALAALCGDALAAVRAHPQHRLAPLRRRAIYARLAGAGGCRAMGHLAVLAAQRCAPRFQAALPHERLPGRMLNLARRVLDQRLAPDSGRVSWALERAYHASGSSWGMDEEDVPWDAHVAALAAAQALREACGQLPLADELALWRQGRAPDGTPALVERDDEDLAYAPLGADATGLAAVACACGAGSPRCDPARLLAFWEWWLGEAIPQAVAR